MKRMTTNRGSALILSLFLMGMLTLVAMMSINTSNTDMELSFNNENGAKAFYIAEAGAKRALAEINNNHGWNEGYVDVRFGGGDYSVDVVDSNTILALLDTILLTSTGQTHAARSAVEFTTAPEEIHPFLYAMFGRDSVDLRNSMSTDSYNSDSGSYWATRLDTCGDAGSNGDIIVFNGATIGGDVVTSLDTGLHIDPGATIIGDTASDAPPQVVPDIPQSEFDAAALYNANDTGIVGTYSYNSTTHAFSTAGDVVLTGGVYYFSSFILKNNASLTLAAGASVTIYVTGDVEIKNTGAINDLGDPADLIFYTQGDLVLKNTADLYGTFYSPNGVADLRNSGDLYGAVVADKIIGHNSAWFHYDRSLRDIVRKDDQHYVVVAWRELY